VIDLISLKPFDMETITNSVKKTRKAIIVEECMKTGGIGASLSSVINESLFDDLDHQVDRFPSLSNPKPLLAVQSLMNHCVMRPRPSD
jgi:pyruvate dehydrogenase E1 component beta subunit